MDNNLTEIQANQEDKTIKKTDFSNLGNYFIWVSAAMITEVVFIALLSYVLSRYANNNSDIIINAYNIIAPIISLVVYFVALYIPFTKYYKKVKESNENLSKSIIEVFTFFTALVILTSSIEVLLRIEGIFKNPVLFLVSVLVFFLGRFINDKKLLISSLIIPLIPILISAVWNSCFYKDAIYSSRYRDLHYIFYINSIIDLIISLYPYICLLLLGLYIKKRRKIKQKQS